MSKKSCENTGCAFKGIPVTTDKVDCIGCGKPIKTDLAATMKDILDGAMTSVDDILKK